MTEKDLHKLRREDLLQLLVSQGKELVRSQEQLSSVLIQLDETDATNERLKRRLDEKDALIEKLKERLDQKDMQIFQFRNKIDEMNLNRQLGQKEASAIAESALKLALLLSGNSEVSQKINEEYLYEARQYQGEQMTGRESQALYEDEPEQSDEDLEPDFETFTVRNERDGDSEQEREALVVQRI